MSEEDKVLASIVLQGCGSYVLMENLVDLLKVNAGWDLEANNLAGRLYHRLMMEHATQTVNQYLSIFESVLKPEIVEFLRRNEQSIEVILAEYIHGPHYDAVKSRGILSAKRFYDTYVLRTNLCKIYESIPHFFMRIAAFCTVQSITHVFLKDSIHEIEKSRNNDIVSDIDLFKYYFEPLSKQLVCCATPIMRSAGTLDGNLVSCFIMTPNMSSELSTTDALYNKLGPLLSVKSGVGCDVTSFSNSGKSIKSCLGLIDAQVEYYNDRNPRPVSVATYMEVWHCQIQEFLSVKMPENPKRCSSIYQGLCIPRHFFVKFLEDPTQAWYLFDPSMSGNLANLYGSEFEEEYERLVAAKRYVSSISIKSLMFMIINTIVKTGSPYIIYKEACNEHHWYNTQGSAIRAANLCAEIIQQPGANVSTCNLANICLPACLRIADDGSEMQSDDLCIDDCLDTFGKDELSSTFFSMPVLHRAVEVAVFVINCAILGGDCVNDAMVEGQNDRSMGLGVHGLADVFANMGYSYLDPKAQALDVAIFEHMYFKSVETSMKIVKNGGKPFKGWEKSKLSKGIFHWSGWDGVSLNICQDKWMDLSRDCTKYGVFNSQFLALMPTVGSSQLTGFSESYYPFFANMSSKVSSKEEIMRPNVTFLKNVPRSDMKMVRYHAGDVSKFPEPYRRRYANFISAFDYPAEEQIFRARLRAPFIDQSQSHSFFLREEDVSSAKYIKDLILSGYSYGLKTIMYYCKVKKQSNMSSFQCLSIDENISSNCCEVDSVDYKEEHIGPMICTNGESYFDCMHCQ